MASRTLAPGPVRLEQRDDLPVADGDPQQGGRKAIEWSQRGRIAQPVIRVEPAVPVGVSEVGDMCRRAMA